MTISVSQSFLRLPEVCRLTGKSRSAIYDAIRKNQFPAQVRTGPRQVAWPSSAIEAWMQECISASADKSA